uniref:Uncharacterized protein n=1 Tax=Panagrellus redivivus TaxID=6233 RepID=A0A7E4ZSI8_PANRE
MVGPLLALGIHPITIRGAKQLTAQSPRARRRRSICYAGGSESRPAALKKQRGSAQPFRILPRREISTPHLFNPDWPAGKSGGKRMPAGCQLKDESRSNKLYGRL